MKQINMDLSNPRKGTPPSTGKVVTLDPKCMRNRTPRSWTHYTQRRDQMTIAVWCGCENCVAMLRTYYA